MQDITPITDERTGSLASRLLRTHVKQHTGKLGLAAICMVFASAATAANAWVMQPVLDEIFLKKNKDMLLIIPIVVLGIALVKGSASYGQNILMKFIAQRVATDMQLKLYEHLLHSDIAMFAKESSGKLISRFSNDIQIIRKNISNVMAGFAKETVTLIFLIGVMFYQSWELSLITMVVFPIAIYPIIRLGKRMRKISEATQEELAGFTSTLDDTFQGIRIVKAYGNEEAEARRASGEVESIFKLYIKAARVESLASPIMETLAGIAIAAVIWYGGYQVFQGVTTPGAFFSFIAAMIMAYKPMKSLSGLNTNLQEALAAVKRYFAVLDTPPTIQDTPDAKPLTIKEASIALENVSFRYDDDKATLKNIAIEVPAGKRAALVGPSGGGKTTIMNLILRFYDPESGKITISNSDIRKSTLQSVRRSIALVNQEATLFDDTVRANIAYSKPDASEEEIIEAAKTAAAHEFINELPEGYDTIIGQHGVRLSGGQRQRIAIARAMLSDAPILLLDEATSSLDTTSEKQIQVALDRLMKDHTTLVIAHRLSTVMDADIIYVIKEGEVIESGRHEELVAAGGEYATLYAHQFEENAA